MELIKEIATWPVFQWYLLSVFVAAFLMVRYAVFDVKRGYYKIASDEIIPVIAMCLLPPAGIVIGLACFFEDVEIKEKLCKPIQLPKRVKNQLPKIVKNIDEEQLKIYLFRIEEQNEQIHSLNNIITTKNNIITTKDATIMSLELENSDLLNSAGRLKSKLREKEEENKTLNEMLKNREPKTNISKVVKRTRNRVKDTCHVNQE